MTDHPPLNPKQWAAVNDVFHRALALPASGRTAFVESACGGQPELRAEILALLEAHERAGTFMERSMADSGGGDLPEVLVGRMVGPYQVHEMLGLGGMGVVYRATDTRLRRDVALKAVKPAYTGDAARRERLKREARAAAQLSHPGIATVYALEEIDGQIFVACELIEGETLREELAHRPLPPDRLLATARDVAAALGAAHSRGIVHRDLKPDNVMRTPEGQIKILDFGLAKLRTGSDSLTLTADGAVLGTPAYMSPEQIRGEDVDGRCDLFALGAMMYELASGRHPFAADDSAATLARILESRPDRLAETSMPSTWSRRALDALDAVVDRCLQKSAGDRYGSARELLTALEAVDVRSAVSEGPPSRPAATAGSSAAPAPKEDAIAWWWQFHQAAVSLSYVALLVVLWQIRDWLPDQLDPWLFLASLVGGVAAVSLRLHLWFVVRTYPAEWPTQRRRAMPWQHLADALFVTALAACGLTLMSDRQGPGVLLITVAIVVLISFTTIEPATTRAAFGAGRSDPDR